MKEPEGVIILKLKGGLWKTDDDDDDDVKNMQNAKCIFDTFYLKIGHFICRWFQC